MLAADVVLVVETTTDCRSLLTADAAVMQRRRLMAVPGSVFLPSAPAARPRPLPGAGLPALVERARATAARVTERARRNTTRSLSE